MDPYDSDSSGLEDEGEYTETGVLLGYSSEEPTGDTISQLGGWPVCRNLQGLVDVSLRRMARY